MSRPVAVMGIDAEGGKHIVVVVCLNPPECYASKDQVHAGWVVAGKFVPAKEDKDWRPARLTEGEQVKVVRAYFALRVALTNIYEVP